MQLMTNLAMTFLGTLGISLFTLPVIVRIIEKLKVHYQPEFGFPVIRVVPALGGFALFFSFIFASTIGLFGNELPELPSLIIASMLIFFVGIKDEILELSSYEMITYDIIAALILVFPAHIRMTTLHGLFGIETLSMVPGVLITCVTVIMVTNAFSLIEDSKGLASILSMLAGLIFGSWFAFNGHYDYAILSFSMVGSVAGLFIHNLSNKRNKVSMGNNGSLFLGMLISVLMIHFNEVNVVQTSHYTPESASAISSLIPGVITYLIILVCVLSLLVAHLIRVKMPGSKINRQIDLSVSESLEGKAKKRGDKQKQRKLLHQMNQSFIK